MKTIILYSLLFFSTINGQTLLLDNFENYNLGDMGTAVNPIGSSNPVLGQGNWITMATNPNGIIPSSVSIVNDATHGKVQQIEGSLDTDVFSVKDLASFWSSRTTGNDVLTTTFDFIVSNATTGASSYIEFDILDPSRSKVLGGYILFLSTLELRGIVYGTSNGTSFNNTTLRFSAAPGLILSPNTWYSISVEINKTTGQVSWNSPQLNINHSRQPYATSGTFGTSVAGLDPTEINYINWQVGSPVISKVDNIKLVAKSNSMLQTAENSHKAEFTIYPNPSHDFIEIKGVEDKESKIIYDSSGKIVLKTSGNKIDISDLPVGKYFIRVSGDSKNRSVFIKK